MQQLELLLLLLEPEALSMYSVCRRGALARSRTLCQGLWPFWLEESEGVLGYSGRSQKRPQAILSGSR